MGDFAETDGLRELIVDLATVPERLMPQVRKVVAKGAVNVKKGWAERWKGHPSLKHLPRAINYDTKGDRTSEEAEIGPDPSRRQGNIAHLIEFGNVEYGTVRNAPIPGGVPALAEEEPKFVQALADLGEKAVGDGLG